MKMWQELWSIPPFNESILNRYEPFKSSKILSDFLISDETILKKKKTNYQVRVLEIEVGTGTNNLSVPIDRLMKLYYIFLKSSFSIQKPVKIETGRDKSVENLNHQSFEKLDSEQEIWEMKLKLKWWEKAGRWTMRRCDITNTKKRWRLSHPHCISIERLFFNCKCS